MSDAGDTSTSSTVAKSYNSNCTIAFKDLSYVEKIPITSGSVATILSPVLNVIDKVTSCGNNTKDFYRVKDISGVVSPGKMKMVIAAPGHGKSTYLKMVANRLEIQTGKLAYNGRETDMAREEGVDLRKLTKYCDQTDCHFALLTVHETIEMAHKMGSFKYDPKVVENIISLLGLEECRDTIIGDEFIKGVSGGQRRRVSIGETLCSDASIIFLDEPTNGLDSATSEDILRGLRKWAIETNSSVVSTVQQPTPGLFETFDEVVVLREGQVIYDGPREDILPFFDAMGYRCPGDVDVCDFLIDVLTQPRLTIDRQRDNDRRLEKAGKPLPVPNLDISFGGSLTMSPTPCVNTDQMVDFYKTTPMWKAIEKVINEVFPSSGGRPDVSKFPSLMPTEDSKRMYTTGYIMPIHQMVRMVYLRQLMLTFRNNQLIAPRIFNAIFMGLVFGSLYYHVPMDNAFLRVAILLISLTQIGFGNMVELPISVSYNRVVLKQMASNFYMPWVYVVSAAFSGIPLMLIEITLLSLLLYFMAFNTRTAACFFTFFAVALAQSFNLSTWFKFLSTMKGGLPAAQSIAGTSTGLMMTFGGFFVSMNNLPVWMRWMMWISPYSWATRALANNEFLSDRYNYDYVDPATGIPVVPAIRTGYQYLNETDMYIGEKWIGFCFLYLIGLSIFLMICHTLRLQQPFYELSIGTRRTDDEEMLDSELDNEGEGAIQMNILAAKEEDEEDAIETKGGAQEHDDEDDMPRTQSMSLVRDASSFNQSTLRTLRESLPFNPTWLSFSHIKYTVQVQKDGQTTDRILLNDISGYAEPGKLTALMGASGAGKTTLLDVLAGRKNAGVIEGNIMFNGQVPTPQQFAAITGYVEQFDSLFAYDTVIETLLFAARLRLPPHVSDDIKVQIVQEVMEILDLLPIQGYIIGNHLMPGLSPSQLKRVNIGIELVANPSILFLDEPTTGLDSKAAQTVMRVVKRIARSGRAIICTIHQPSAELAYLFDRLTLLGSGGHQIFFGDVGHRFTKFIKYLQSVPGVNPCPPRYNPASWMLEELGVGVASAKEHGEAEGPQETQAEIIQRFKDFYFKARVARRLFARLHALENLTGVEQDIEYSVSRNTLEAEGRSQSYSVSTIVAALPTAASTVTTVEQTSLGFQLRLLQYRQMTSYWRNPSFLFSRIAVLIILALVFGCIYFDLDITTQSGVISGISSRTVSSNFGSLIHGATCMPIFFANRATFYRERASNYYNPGLYSLVQVTTEMFWTAITAMIYTLIVYFMVNMKQTAEAFFLFYLAFYLMAMVFISMACLVVSIAPSMPVAGVLQGMSFSFFFTFAGVAISKPNIKAGWLWVYHMLPVGHITAMLASSQFGGLNHMIGTKTVSEFVADYLAIEYGTNYYFQHFGWVCLFMVVVQAMSFTATYLLVFSSR